MNKLISVVIPVYKVEDYICKCLDSLLVPQEQLELLDVVIINDGTPDKSADMARKYESRYPGIFRVIDQENRGHGGAWNHGTELAVGKYLFYLDSDDWFDTAEFSRLIDYLKDKDTDMVMLDAQTYRAASDTYEKRNFIGTLEAEKYYNANEFDWVGCGIGFKLTYAHETVYRTTMMQRYLPIFCEHVMYDDVSLQVIPIVIAKDFIYTHIDVYRYYVGRPGQSFDPKVRAVRAAQDVTTVLKFCLNWVERNINATPSQGTRRKWAETEYQEMGTWHYRELALFPMQISRPSLKEWDEYLKREHSDIRPNSLVKMYRMLPFVVFYCVFHTNILIERCTRFVKRKLSHRNRF